MRAQRFNHLLRTKDSDADAYRELIDHYFARIVMHIDYKFEGRVDGEEIAQRFFVRLLVYKPTATIRNPTPWVMVCADNLARDELRTQRHYSFRQPEPTAPANPYRLSVEMQEALAVLDADEQYLILQHYWEKATLKEIARAMGRPYHKVVRLHARAKRKLKDKL